MGFGLVLLQCSGKRVERSAVLDEHLGAGGESADTRVPCARAAHLKVARSGRRWSRWPRSRGCVGLNGWRTRKGRRRAVDGVVSRDAFGDREPSHQKQRRLSAARTGESRLGLLRSRSARCDGLPPRRAQAIASPMVFARRERRPSTEFGGGRKRAAAAAAASTGRWGQPHCPLAVRRSEAVAPVGSSRGPRSLGGPSHKTGLVDLTSGFSES